MKNSTRSWAESLAKGVAARPGRVWIAVLLTLFLAAWGASRLRLEGDLAALLPAGSPAAEDYRAFLDAFGGYEKVFLLVLPADPAADGRMEGRVLEAADRLADGLRRSPELRNVRSGLEESDQEFFLRYVIRRAPLFLPPASLEELPARLDEESVHRQAARLRSTVHSPAGGARLPLLRHDPLELSLDLPLLRAGGLDLPVDGISGAFFAPSAEGLPPVALVMATPTRSEVDPEGGRILARELERIWTETREALSKDGVEDGARDGEDGSDLRLLAVGGPLYAAQDERVMRRDLEATLTGSAIGCAVLLLLAFRGPRIPLATLLAVGVALAWTAGLLGVVFGRLTAPGLGFAAVLVGLGIDYGIHGGVRYRQALADGESAAGALDAALRRAGPAILTSALTTAAAFAVLGLAHFRPLREMGWVVALGILSILLATIFVGGATVCLALPRRTTPGAPGAMPGAAAPGRTGPLWRLLDRGVRLPLGLAERRPRAVLAAALVLSVAGALGVTRLELTTDLSSLRPADHPALEAEEILQERFALGLDTTTLVLHAAGLDELLARSEAAAGVVRRHAPGAEILSPSDWLLPAEAAAERLAALERLPFAEAAEILRPALRKQNLAPAAFEPGLEALEAFGRGEDPGKPATDDWPDGLRELVRLPEELPQGEGVYRGALRVRTPGDTWTGGPPEAFFEDLRAVDPRAAVASVPRLGESIRRVAQRDLEVLLLAAFAVVVAVVLASFRGSVWRAALALVPVLLGSLWTLGIWGLLGGGIDLLGLAVVPILLGIGIDDGLHAVHGSDEGGLVASIRHAALAMALTTLTTAVGFGSLMLSSLPGLRAGGFLVAGGVVACLAATLLVLPALARVRRT